MSEDHSGTCLCGAVRFRTRGQLRGVLYCHCSQCRRQSGHFVAMTSAPVADLAIDGAENLAWYSATPEARRGFCRNCGSFLFWRQQGSEDVSISAGALDKPTGLRGESHIFVDDKGDYYQIDDALPKFHTWTDRIESSDR